MIVLKIVAKKKDCGRLLEPFRLGFDQLVLFVVSSILKLINTQVA